MIAINSISAFLKSVKVNDGRILRLPDRNTYVDSRGRVIAEGTWPRDLHNIRNHLYPYISSVLIFEGKIKICL